MRCGIWLQLWRKLRVRGVKILSAPDTTDDGRMSAIVEFPGGYIAEIHRVAVR
jgi:hypothetical protein